jgi:hypothetical protein|tara:strand:- start:383 stop:517 length:135 start_codon:yes stop_codon:yes gene_type:complete
MTSEELAVPNRSNYAISPHTDATHRFRSQLFYFSQDNFMEHLDA